MWAKRGQQNNRKRQWEQQQCHLSTKGLHFGSGKSSLAPANTKRSTRAGHDLHRPERQGHKSAIIATSEENSLKLQNKTRHTETLSSPSFFSIWKRDFFSLLLGGGVIMDERGWCVCACWLSSTVLSLVGWTGRWVQKAILLQIVFDEWAVALNAARKGGKVNAPWKTFSEVFLRFVVLLSGLSPMTFGKKAFYYQLNKQIVS